MDDFEVKVNERNDPKMASNSKKRKNLPPVRQTLTSYKRLLQANPLLRYQEAGIDIDKLFTSNAGNEKLGERPSLPPCRAFENSFQQIPNVNGSKKPVNLVRSNSLKSPRGSQKSKVTFNTNRPLTKFSIQHTVTSQQNKIFNFVRPTTSNIISGNNRYSAKPSTVVKNPSSNSNRQEKASNNPSSRPSITRNILPKTGYKPPTAVKSRYLQSVMSAATSNTAAKRKKDGEENNDWRKKEKKPSLRRSLSSGHLQSKKGKQFDPQVAFSKLNTTRSEENINVVKTPIFSPIFEENVTPSAHKRRSIDFRGKIRFQSSTPAAMKYHTQQTLANQLTDWLEKHGKRMSEFKHLRCFGIHNHQKESIISEKDTVDEENKENIEISNDRSESFENLRIDENHYNSLPRLQQKEEPNKHDKDIATIIVNNEDGLVKCVLKCTQNQTDLHLVAKDALKEVNKLIEEGYPKDHCVSWLELIREKYTELEDEPEYWECRAAIEKTEGNIGNAVEYYKTAIMHGGEVNTIEASLDGLLKKFSLLHISPNTQPGRECRLRRREKIEQDARNVFKSTIIQFALETRQKKTKEKTSQSVKKQQVTPVRRSTRLSRSAYTSTSGMQLYDTLKELSGEEYDFKRNKALI